MQRHRQLRYPCGQCHKAFTYKHVLNRHFKNKHANERYQCDECGKLFVQKAGVVTHKKTVHAPGRKSAAEKLVSPKCNVCNKAFRFESTLRRHIEGIHNKSKFMCQYCGKSYTQNGHLLYHIKMRHSATMDFPCVICDKQFAYRYQLKKHMNNSHQIPNARIEEADNYTVHTLTPDGISNQGNEDQDQSGNAPSTSSPDDEDQGQSGNAPSTSTQVGEDQGQSGNAPSTSTQVSEDQDKSSNAPSTSSQVHEGQAKSDSEENRKCHVCFKVFKSKSVMNRHVESIHNKTKFVCQFCGKEYSQNGHLLYHIKMQHNTHKDYICIICCKHFAYKYQFKKHMKCSHQITDAQLQTSDNYPINTLGTQEGLAAYIDDSGGLSTNIDQRGGLNTNIDHSGGLNTNIVHSGGINTNIDHSGGINTNIDASGGLNTNININVEQNQSDSKPVVLGDQNHFQVLGAYTQIVHSDHL